LHPYRTHVLCPLDLCPNLCLGSAEVAGEISTQRGCTNFVEGLISLGTPSAEHPFPSRPLPKPGW
jgi:hypothetical protein